MVIVHYLTKGHKYIVAFEIPISLCDYFSQCHFELLTDDAKYANEALLYVGHLMHLVCNISVDNSTEFNLQWYKDGQLITLIRYPKIIITRYLAQVSKNFVSDLFIDKLSKHDAGIYECHGPGGVVDSTRVKVIKGGYNLLKGVRMD